MSTISISLLTKQFGDFVALDAVSLDVADGEFLTVLGPSGSGKTTMLLTIAGFEQPTSGSIRIDDADVTNMPAHRRQVGLTFQSYALFPHMSVRGNVEFPLRVRGISRKDREEQVARALDLVRLRGFERRRPQELSGGQQQRVALARAFVFEPDLLLLDEPLAALDRQLRQTVQVELGELQRSLGLTTIAVTHDQEEALTMSDRILVLDRGQLQQHGPPEDVYRRPCNSFVASFLGTANLFAGTVGRHDGAQVLRWDEGRVDLPIDCPQPEAPVVAMLRPEQIQITAPGQRNGLTGEVQTAVYLGTATRYRVRTATGCLIEVTEPGVRRFSVSEHVVLTWQPADMWVLPEATTGSSEASTAAQPPPQPRHPQLDGLVNGATR